MTGGGYTADMFVISGVKNTDLESNTTLKPRTMGLAKKTSVMNLKRPLEQGGGGSGSEFTSSSSSPLLKPAKHSYRQCCKPNPLSDTRASSNLEYSIDGYSPGSSKLPSPTPSRTSMGISREQGACLIPTSWAYPRDLQRQQHRSGSKFQWLV